MEMFEPIKVLIAADDEITAEGLKRMIEVHPKLEFVGTVHDGAFIIDATARLKPDVVLMDIRSPMAERIEMTRQITKDYPKTKMVIVTSSEKPDDVFATLTAGAQGYCLKSSSLLQLSFAIQAVHRGAIWLDKRVAHSIVKKGHGGPPPAAQSGEASNELGLSPRQQAVLNLVAEGKTNREIAAHLGISSQTVKSHLRAIMSKLMVGDRTQAAVKAARRQYNY